MCVTVNLIHPMSVHFLSCYLYKLVKVQHIRAWLVAFWVLPDRAAFTFTKRYLIVGIRCPKLSYPWLSTDRSWQWNFFWAVKMTYIWPEEVLPSLHKSFKIFNFLTFSSAISLKIRAWNSIYDSITCITFCLMLYKKIGAFMS